MVRRLLNTLRQRLLGKDAPADPPRRRFPELDLPKEILRGVEDLGFTHCTPIQAEILPSLLRGSDATGRAQTGTGKTAAFLIAAFTHILRKPLDGRRPGAPRVLVLAPTRELVLQIEKEAHALGKHCGCHVMAVIGGVPYEEQRHALSRPVDILVATPGRLLDLKRGSLHLGHVEILVIDEADRMLDMGFIPDIRRIVHSLPPRDRRQTLMFSATLTPEVARLASQWTREPVAVEIDREQVAVSSVNQVVYITTARDKFKLLLNLLLRESEGPVLVFGNRRDITRRLTDRLRDHGIHCALLSGEVSQVTRQKTLEDFRGGRLRVLVATDVAGRGLHVEGISHVINYNLPHDPEDYVHRIGRTGRAGATGTSVSFACEDDSFMIPDIEAYMGRELRCTYPDDALLAEPPPPIARKPQPRPPAHAPRHAAGRAPARDAAHPPGDEAGRTVPAGAPKRRRRRRGGRGRGRPAGTPVGPPRPSA
ncbi:MAG: DEAD/DEAH box helicase [Lentisphaerae bacterium]|nr:DEAD/DEAH box helicase [Lentisphaerota bacterium]